MDGATYGPGAWGQAPPVFFFKIKIKFYIFKINLAFGPK